MAGKSMSPVSHLDFVSRKPRLCFACGFRQAIRKVMLDSMPSRLSDCASGDMPIFPRKATGVRCGFGLHISMMPAVRRLMIRYRMLPRVAV